MITTMEVMYIYKLTVSGGVHAHYAQFKIVLSNSLFIDLFIF